MRAYFFVNKYLSSIQQGIQALHCTHELFVKYNHQVFSNSEEKKMLFDWAENHKTVIILNGGTNEDLITINNLIVNLRIPNTNFHEEALGNTLTCVGCIVPEYYYSTPIEEIDFDLLTEDNLPFISILQNARLAI